MIIRKNALLCLILLPLLLTSIALAADITPYADIEFSRATASLTTYKSVSFSCITHQPKEKIAITECWLERKINNEWYWLSSLDSPSTVAENTALYTAVMDYSADIGSGTYRIGFIVDADGYSITRYSNERTF